MKLTKPRTKPPVHFSVDCLKRVQGAGTTQTGTQSGGMIGSIFGGKGGG